MYNNKGPKTPEGIGIEWDKISVLRWRGQFTEQEHEYCRQKRKFYRFKAYRLRDAQPGKHSSNVLSAHTVFM
jgi:hypothetical protein